MNNVRFPVRNTSHNFAHPRKADMHRTPSPDNSDASIENDLVSINAHQWGILALCALYTWSWARGFRAHWLRRAA